MKKIVINESQIDLINEGLSDLLYHFTSWQNGLKICETDTIYLQSAFAKDADNYDKKRKFYLSCTRIRNTDFGYSRKFNDGGVRIVLDGRKLSQKFKGKPVNYWSGLGDKYHITNSVEKYGKNFDPDNSWEIERYKKEHPDATEDELNNFIIHNFNRSAQEHIGNESEDRIFSYEPSIQDAHEYIISIDVLLPKEDIDSIARAFWSTLLSNKIKIYASKEEFNKTNGKALTFDDISYDSDIKLRYKKNKEYKRALLSILSNVIAFIAYGNAEFGRKGNSYKIDENKFFANVKNLLKKYDLSDFINNLSEIYKKVAQFYSLESIIDSLNANRRDLSDEPNAYKSKIAKMMTDYFLSIGADSFRQACQIKSQMIKGENYSSNIDWNITSKLFINKNKNIVSVNPDKDKFIDFEQWDDDECKYAADSLSWNIMNEENSAYHTSSKNSTSLFHFLYKMFRTWSVKQVYETFVKMGLDNEILNSCGIYIDIKEMNYFDATNFHTINSYEFSKEHDYNEEGLLTVNTYSNKI